MSRIGPLLFLFPLLAVVPSAFAQPVMPLPPELAPPELDPLADDTDYGAAAATTAGAIETNHQSAVLRESGLKNYAKGEIDFELLDLTTNALDDNPTYPPELEALDGKQVEFLGFMTPYDSIDEFQRFMLVNFPTGCNFCAIPRLQEIVFVQVDLSKEPPPFIEGITKVKGTLNLKRAGSKYEVQGWLPDEKHDVFSEFIYIIGDATAEPYAPTKNARQPWFWPAIGAVTFFSLALGLFVYKRDA